MNLPRRYAGGADQLIDIDRAWTKRRHDHLAIALTNVRQRLRRPMLVRGSKLDRRDRGPAEDRRERFQNIARRGDERQAPCFRRLLVPAERGSSGLPGTAKTSRPCSPPKRAVISEPERSAASITTTPREIPEISRLRRGKSLPRGEKSAR
jgi:hypothetical protein